LRAHFSREFQQDVHCLLALDLAQLALSSRKTSWCEVPWPGSAGARSTAVRSSSVSGSSSTGALSSDNSTGSISARRILRAAGTSPAGMWYERVQLLAIRIGHDSFLFDFTHR
jgi:hypothetical protein